MWYKDLFDQRLSAFWVEIYFSEKWKSNTEKEIVFLRSVLKKGVVLDLCCGPGRHSVPLSSFGRVVSFDLSRYLLSALRERCRSVGVYENVSLVEGTMKQLPFKSGFFDDVINLQTSFGYLSDKENEEVLHEVSRVLKPKGVFVLEIANPEWIIANFQPRSWDETQSFSALEERRLDWKMKRMRSRWIMISKKDGKIGEVLVDNRLYDLSEVEELLVKAGFEVAGFFGSPEREEFHTAKSRRILLVAKKLSRSS